jgi:hypothetical protein
MTEKLTAVEFDGLTGETTQRDLNSQEIQDLELRQQEAKATQDEIDSRKAARESALFKLAALGLTEEEIAAL